jgi:hypothetical protein
VTLRTLLSLSEAIKDDYKLLSIKINYKDDFDKDNLEEPPTEFYSVQSYLHDNKVEIIYSTLGLHLNGESNKPHSHYHLVVRGFPSSTFVYTCRNNLSGHLPGQMDLPC